MATEPYRVDLKSSNPLIDIGSKAAGGLFGMFAGPTWQDKGSEWLFNYLKRTMNKPVIGRGQVESYIPGLEASLAPSRNAFAGETAKRVGLGSGVGQGEMAHRGYGDLMRLFNELKQRAMFTNAQAPMQKANLMSSLTR